MAFYFCSVVSQGLAPSLAHGWSQELGQKRVDPLLSLCCGEKDPASPASTPGHPSPIVQMLGQAWTGSEAGGQMQLSIHGGRNTPPASGPH